MSRSNRRAFTIRELIAVLVCIAIILVIVVIALVRSERSHVMRGKDSAQLRSMHQSFLTFSAEFGGVFPKPGLIDRLPDPVYGEMPGRGPEDVEANTTANLYSVMIMQNYFTPDFLVSPIERNPRVQPLGDSYDYTKYNALHEGDTYWDGNFKADLVTGSNASYAHMPICGERAAKHWRETMGGSFPVIGNRGPKDGKPDPSSFTCGPHGTWSGNVSFGAQIQFLTNTQPENLTYRIGDEAKPDNLFAMESGPEGSDAILAFTKTMSKEAKPELQFD